MDLRRWAAVSVMAGVGYAAAMDDAGAGGDVALTDDQRSQLLERVAQTQAQQRLERQLATLYAAVAAFADVDVAMATGYAPAGGCMVGARGAQGIHFAHEDLMADPVVVAEQPQLLMYEPAPDGSLSFLGVEYLVFQQAWHDAGNLEPPVLFGQTFGLNETLLDEPFYLLHVWVGRFNPSGLFADWNPLVDCSSEAAFEPGAAH